MGERNIWNRLRNAGLSEAGTAGVMGNLYAESLLKSNNVENRCPQSDEVYTDQVDNGTKSAYTFSHDAYGYGLAQWTFYARKEALYKFAHNRGVSISDESMQVDFLLAELKDYANLYSYLKDSTSILASTSKFCMEFERPAVNNISARLQFAQGIYNRNHGNSVPAEQPKAEPLKTMTANMPVLKVGAKGVAVGMIQFALNKKGYLPGAVDCDFGNATAEAVRAFQADNAIDVDGIVGRQTWGKIYL